MHRLAPFASGSNTDRSASGLSRPASVLSHAAYERLGRKAVTTPSHPLRFCMKSAYRKTAFAWPTWQPFLSWREQIATRRRTGQIRRIHLASRPMTMQMLKGKACRSICRDAPGMTLEINSESEVVQAKTVRHSLSRNDAIPHAPARPNAACAPMTCCQWLFCEGAGALELLW